MHHQSSLHLLTAGAYYVIGATLIVVALRMWWRHPLRRAFVLGPYLTAAGVIFLMRIWPLMFLFGAFIFSCAVEHHADWLVVRGTLPPAVMQPLGQLEAGISWLTALALLWLFGRGLWNRRRR